MGESDGVSASLWTALCWAMSASTKDVEARSKISAAGYAAVRFFDGQVSRIVKRLQKRQTAGQAAESPGRDIPGKHTESSAVPQPGSLSSWGSRLSRVAYPAG